MPYGRVWGRWLRRFSSPGLGLLWRPHGMAVRGKQMKCPYCSTSFHPQWETITLGSPTIPKKGHPQFWFAAKQQCPECKGSIVAVRNLPDNNPLFIQITPWTEDSIVWPRERQLAQVPPEIPPTIAQDYREARAVLSASPQASAALSRRCLQQMLEERGVSTKHDLSKAIDDALATGLPSHIAADLDAIREVGNFSAHPQKSQHSGEILPVEPHEAEWTLDVLGQLFDHYYVKPARAFERRAAFNDKLADAGRKPLKGSPSTP